MVSRRRLRHLEIARVVEREEPAFDPVGLIPDATPEGLAPYRQWLEPDALDPATGLLILPIQGYVVRTRRHVILVDACLGEDKTCRWHLPWHRMKGLRFLDDLAAFGVAPEAVDFVCCTHLHGDHVGWNTRRVDGRWVPTFPNARYVIAKRELDHWVAYNARAGAEDYEECIDESVLPVVEAGRAALVEGDFAFDDEAWIEPLPGHTPGHMGVRLRSGGAEGVMIGDLMHSPVQCARPEWSASSDADPDLARAVRRRFLDAHAETATEVLTAHFPSPSVGLVRRAGAAYRFDYLA
jgi:glyoxylase-like metal-dependent hydrolase (beta-lactamase superfamily II)